MGNDVDPRPKEIGRRGFLERDGRLLSAQAMTTRALVYVLAIALIEIFSPGEHGHNAIYTMFVFQYIGIEMSGVVLGRVVDNLLWVERRLQERIEAGGDPKGAWNRE